MVRDVAMRRCRGKIAVSTQPTIYNEEFQLKFRTRNDEKRSGSVRQIDRLDNF